MFIERWTGVLVTKEAPITKVIVSNQWGYYRSQCFHWNWSRWRTICSGRPIEFQGESGYQHANSSYKVRKGVWLVSKVDLYDHRSTSAHPTMSSSDERLRSFWVHDTNKTPAHLLTFELVHVQRFIGTSIRQHIRNGDVVTLHHQRRNNELPTIGIGRKSV